MAQTLNRDEFLNELMRGPLARDLEAERERQRVENTKKLIAERSKLAKKFESEFPKLERAEQAAMDEFRDANEKLEAARLKANQAYFNRESAQTAFDRELGKITGEIIAGANPLWRDLTAKLREIGEEAAKIRVVVEIRATAQNSKIIPLKPQGEKFSNLAARIARQSLPSKIASALHDAVLSGHDSDAELHRIFDAGIAALPAAETMRPHDTSAAKMSPLCEAAFEEFAARVDAALNTAMTE